MVKKSIGTVKMQELKWEIIHFAQQIGQKNGKYS
jgi:hypothetical protein